MLPHALRRALRSNSARICIANAADGHKMGLHTSLEVRAIGDAVVKEFSSKALTDQTDDGFLAAVDDACRGKHIGSYRRLPSSFVGKSAVKLGGGVACGFSTVVTASAIPHIIDKGDFARLCGDFLITGLASGAIDVSSYAERALMDRSPAAREKRKVRLAASAKLGDAIVWMTKTPVADELIDKADASGTSRATAVTDALGLILPKFQAGASALNQRFILHVPPTVIARKSGFRPTFAEAGGYTRFKAKPVGTAAPGWGKTLDLGVLADSGRLADGADEITLWPFTAADFRPGEAIELEYLGEISASRGEQVNDNDQAVAGLMMQGRNVAAALRGMR